MHPRLVFVARLTMIHSGLLHSFSPLSAMAFSLGWSLEWLKKRFKKSRALKFPISFPTAGCEMIPSSETAEEEFMPEFAIGHYFPVNLGDILLSRLQIVGKLGWGVTSTVWLVRDLEYATRFDCLHLGTK